MHPTALATRVARLLKVEHVDYLLTAKHFVLIRKSSRSKCASTSVETCDSE